MNKIYYPNFRNLIGSVLTMCGLVAGVTPVALHAQPVISGVSPAVGIPVSTTVTISGSGFDAADTNNVVYFGQARGTVTAASTSSLSVQVPVGASFDPVTVLNRTTHYIGASGLPFQPKFDNACFIPNAFNFKPQHRVSVGAGTFTYIGQLGDLDGDGKIDMVTANHFSGSPNIAVYQNAGAPGTVSYNLITTLNPSGRVSNIKLADLDGDGKLDIIAAMDASVFLAVFHNQSTPGTIAFSASRALRVSWGGAPVINEVSVADFDGDGKMDIAAASAGDDSVKVLRNITTGPITGAFATTHFANYQSFKAASIPTSLFSADLDNDGKVDIGTVCGYDGSGLNSYFSVLRNTSTSGTISFATHIDSLLGHDLTGIELQAADLDNDGKMDVMISTNGSSSSYLSLFRNTSSGAGTIRFASKVDYTPAGLPTGVTSGDFDGDGKMDIVIADNSSGQVKLLRNTHTSGNFNASSFASPVSLSVMSNPVAVTVGDADGDKKPDIFVGCSSSSGSGAGYVSILRNYPLPYVDVITGHSSICIAALTDTMRNTIAGGYWTSQSPSIASIHPTSGIVTPISAGVDTIIYTVVCQGDTNSVKKAITILASPTVSTTTGPVSFCSADSVLLSNSTSGGTWSSSNMSAATVSTAGRVRGIAGGNTIISYTVTNICASVTDTQMVRVYQSPGPITGTLRECVGATSFLGNAYSGGTWSASPVSTATVSIGGGVYGVSVGTATITYSMPGGCYVTATDTVGATGTAGTISGPSSVCNGSSITLSTTGTGGTWSSGTTSVATISSSGVVYALSTGTTMISYTVTSPCGPVYGFYNVTVNAMPGAITGTSTVCSGASTVLHVSPTGGAWTSSDGTIAMTSDSTITGGATTGTATITYTMPGGCYSTYGVTVNPSPVAISGSSSVCVGYTTTYTDATTPGTWSVSSSSIGSINSSTGSFNAVSAGSVVISYTSTTYSCTVTRTVVVNNNPGTISGPSSVCNGSTISLSDSPTPGTWSSSFPAVATVVSSGAGTGTVTGGVAGVTTITYTSTATGCFATTSVTTLPRPSAIIGASTVCLNALLTLSDTTAGGTWSSVSTSVASITSAGVVRPLSVGSSSIRYTLSTGCYANMTVTVNPVPAAITGPSAVCPDYTITLSDASTSATWSTADTNIARVVSGTGVVTGVAAGTVNISYSYISTSCGVAYPVTVNPAPAAITGAGYICRGYTVTYINTTGGGRWFSSDSAIAKIDSNTGAALGRAAGTVVLTYTTPTFGCSAFRTVTVNPVVTPAVGMTLSTPTTICAGTAVTFTANTVNGGTAPTFDWRINGVPSSTGPTLTYVPYNLDSVSVKIHSNAVCAIPDSARTYVRMTVNPLLTPGVNIINSSSRDTLCTGAAVTFNPAPINGGTAPSYKWYVNGVLVWLGSTYSYFPSNSDVISLTMTSNVTCRVRDSATSAHTLTVSPYVNPTVTMLGSDTACEGYPHIMHAISTYPGVSPVYSWYTNGTLAAGATSTYYAPVLVDGDNVQVKMTSNWPCLITPNASSNIDTVTVIQVDTPIVHLDVYPGWILTAGSTAWFQATVTGGGAHPTYRWFKNSIPIAGATTDVYNTNTFMTGDSFVVRVTNTDVCNGITSFDFIRLTIGDNVGVYNVEKKDADMQVAPNPNTGTFTINGITEEAITEDVDVTITNMVGQTVYTGVLQMVDGHTDTRITLDGNAANGIYMVNLQSAHISKVIRFVMNR